MQAEGLTGYASSHRLEWSRRRHGNGQVRHSADDPRTLAEMGHSTDHERPARTASGNSMARAQAQPLKVETSESRPNRLNQTTPNPNGERKWQLGILRATAGSRPSAATSKSTRSSS